MVSSVGFLCQGIPLWLELLWDAMVINFTATTLQQLLWDEQRQVRTRMYCHWTLVKTTPRRQFNWRRENKKYVNNSTSHYWYKWYNLPISFMNKEEVTLYECHKWYLLLHCCTFGYSAGLWACIIATAIEKDCKAERGDWKWTKYRPSWKFPIFRVDTPCFEPCGKKKKNG